MRHLLFAILLILLAFSPGSGQDLADATTTRAAIVSRSRVTVRVLDKFTLRPVNATIIVVGQKPGQQIVPAFEDRVYQFRIPAEDTSDITIYADGYETLSESIAAGKMRSSEVFYLTPKSGRGGDERADHSLVTKPILREEITYILYFSQSRTTMLGKSKSDLARMLDYLKHNETVEIELAGHTDSKGDPVKNFQLSSDRAALVRKYLIANQIVPARITSRAFGSKMPAAPNDTEKNRQLNRRVEMRVKAGVQ
jgi:OOP family OmpA-OmpF porin